MLHNFGIGTKITEFLVNSIKISDRPFYYISNSVRTFISCLLNKFNKENVPT